MFLRTFPQTCSLYTSQTLLVLLTLYKNPILQILGILECPEISDLALDGCSSLFVKIEKLSLASIGCFLRASAF